MTPARAISTTRAGEFAFHLSREGTYYRLVILSTHRAEMFAVAFTEGELTALREALEPPAGQVRTRTNPAQCAPDAG